MGKIPQGCDFPFAQDTNQCLHILKSVSKAQHIQTGCEAAQRPFSTPDRIPWLELPGKLFCICKISKLILYVFITFMHHISNIYIAFV